MTELTGGDALDAASVHAQSKILSSRTFGLWQELRGASRNRDANRALRALGFDEQNPSFDGRQRGLIAALVECGGWVICVTSFPNTKADTMNNWPLETQTLIMLDHIYSPLFVLSALHDGRGQVLPVDIDSTSSSAGPSGAFESLGDAGLKVADPQSVFGALNDAPVYAGTVADRMGW